MSASPSNVDNLTEAPVANTLDEYTSNLDQITYSDACRVLPLETSKSWHPGKKQQKQHSQSSVVSVRSRNALVMHVRTQTWLADSHGLFDYESRSIVTREFKCTCLREIYHICRIGSEVRLLSETEAELLYKSDTRAQPLVIIRWENGCYYLYSPDNNLNEQNKKLWLVVRHINNNSVVVNQGDLLRLGRFELRVKEIVMSPDDEENGLRLLRHDDDDDDCETLAPDPIDSAGELDGSYQNDEKTNNLIKTTTFKKISLNDKSKKEIIGDDEDDRLSPKICRICLCEAAETEKLEFNPLVSPCECKGSMKWVHLQCLRTWMAGRLNIQNDGNMVSFYWRELECELCRLAYPPVVKVKRDLKNIDEKKEENTKEKTSWKTLDLFEIPKLDCPYAIFEPKTNQQDRGLHIVSLANNKIAKLGRGHDSDIRLADISVSRLHSTLKYQSVTKRSTASSLITSHGIGHETSNNGPGFIFLEDNRSKFGTLIELKPPLKIQPNTTALSIQAGRTVINISLRRRWRVRMPNCIQRNTADIYVVFYQQPSLKTLPNNDETIVQNN